MNDPTQFDRGELPSVRSLVLASVAAVIVAAALTVTVVLPAEWGVDPTGLGGPLGLTAVGALKQGDPPGEVAYAFRRDELSLTLQPGQGSEIKAIMRAGDQLVYAWSGGGELFFDFHGEPKGAPADVFTSYEKGAAAAAEGAFEAPFEGTHGWYWKNKTSEPVTVTLTTSGVYASISRK